MKRRLMKPIPLIAGLLILSILVLAGLAVEPPQAEVPRIVDPNFTFGLRVKDDSFRELVFLERKIGRRADMYLLFNKLGESFAAKSAQRLVEDGYYVVQTLEFWEGKNPDSRYSLKSISQGEWDYEIDRWARELRDFGYPIVLRPLHEFNGFWYPWGAYSGENKIVDFIPAWKHIVDRFRMAVATNVRFELGFNRFNPDDRTDSWSLFYPGDEYVDIVGINIYNRPPDQWHQWQSFDELFAESYQRATALTNQKPIWIQEIASTGKGGNKADWIREAFSRIRTAYPKVESVTWFNYSDVESEQRDWALETSPESLEAFREAVIPKEIAVVTTRKLLVGVFMPSFPPERNLQGFEAEVGRRMDIINWFQKWDEPSVTNKLSLVCNRGSIPLITWEPWTGRDESNPYTLRSIAGGDHDQLIRDWVIQMGQTCQNKTILVRFAHEMNTPPGEIHWYPWQGDPEAYVAAWQHVVKISREIAPNIKWVWAPAWGNTDAPLYWPGEEYVDYLGLTVLNFWRKEPDLRTKWWSWKSFRELYEPQRSTLLDLNKPVIIAELATGEGPTMESKGQWIREMFEVLHSYPEVAGIVWFNAEHAREFTDIEWRLNSSPESLKAFRESLTKTE